MTENKRPGRPRQYESSSAKVSAFRQRQESAGFLRKEVLVTKETSDRLAALAKQHDVSTLDVASALLEHGLAHYENEQAPALFSPEPVFAAAAMPRSFIGNISGSSLSAASANALVQEPATYETTYAQGSCDQADPIKQFFARRKEARNDK